PSPRPVVVHLYFTTQRWPRANKGHLSSKHVDQLRQLIQAVLAQRPSDPRDSGILAHLEQHAVALGKIEQSGELRLRVAAHRAELQHAEGLAVQADAVLSEHRGTA